MDVKIISDKDNCLAIEVNGEHYSGYDPLDSDASAISCTIEALITQARKGADINISFENYYDTI